jgi:hypothetical protein
LKTDWQRLCHGAGFQISRNRIRVTFADLRQQLIRVSQTDATFELETTVARPGITRRLDEPDVQAWRRNRSTKLVGFRLNQDGALIGESWIPKVGLTPEEFCFYVRQLAAEADRFEFLLTGQDRE